MEKIFYLAQILGVLNTLAIGFIVISIIALFVFAVWYFTDGLYDPSDYEEDEAHTCKKWLKTSIITIIVATLVAIFVPNKQTYLFMVGGHALEEIAKNERVQERASHTIDLLDQYLENKVKESNNE